MKTENVYKFTSALLVHLSFYQFISFFTFKENPKINTETIGHFYQKTYVYYKMATTSPRDLQKRSPKIKPDCEASDGLVASDQKILSPSTSQVPRLGARVAVGGPCEYLH